MNPSPHQPAFVTAAKSVFWHAASSLTGAALARKSAIHRALPWAPPLVGGALAFALGRLVGEIIRLWR